MEIDWFGFFYDGEAPDYDTYGPHWIYHAVHGWLYWQLQMIRIVLPAFGFGLLI